MNVLRGRCRCGNVAVTFRTETAPEALGVRACQCSFCRAHDARTVTDPAGSAVVAIADARLVERHRFALRTADFLVCRGCGTYVAAVLADGGRAFATIDAALLAPPLLQASRPVAYDGQSAAERVARRRDAWTPVEIVEVADGHAPEHLAAARGLFEEYQRGLGVDLCFQGFDRELATLPGDYTPPRGRLLLARAAGGEAGCGALRPLDAPDVCEMKRLYVRAAYRGTGLGRLLAQRLVAEARAAGYARMRLDTLPAMTEARALYASLGFREIPPYRHNPVEGVRFLELELAVTNRTRA